MCATTCLCSGAGRVILQEGRVSLFISNSSRAILFLNSHLPFGQISIVEIYNPSPKSDATIVTKSINLVT